MSNPVIRIPAQGRTIAVVGDVYRFLATSEDTNGSIRLGSAGLASMAFRAEK